MPERAWTVEHPGSSSSKRVLPARLLCANAHGARAVKPGRHVYSGGWVGRLGGEQTFSCSERWVRVCPRPGVESSQLPPRYDTTRNRASVAR